MLTASQVRSARGLLDWSQQILADEAGLGLSTIKRVERSANMPGLYSTAEKIRETLENAGIVFIDAGPDGGPGVRLAK